MGKSLFELELIAAWAATWEGKRCVVCRLAPGPVIPSERARRGLPGARRLSQGRVQGHHAIRRQYLERFADEIGMPRPLIVWDPRLAVPVCGTIDSNRCHDRHTNRAERIPRSCLPAPVFDAVADYGLESELEREYPQ